MGKRRHLSNEDIKLMREMRQEGALQVSLSRRFGVSQGSVSMIVRGFRRLEAGGPIETSRRYFHGR